MKKVIFLILFAILQTNVFARECNKYYSNYGKCSQYYMPNCASAETECQQNINRNFASNISCHGKRVAILNSVSFTCDNGPNGIYGSATFYATCCTDRCAADSLSCNPPNVWNSDTCTCDPPPPPPCQVYQVCITYWNDGNGGADPLQPNEIPAIDPNYTGQGYYAMRLFQVDSCKVPPEMKLVMDVPGTCEQHGYCPQGQNNCENPVGSSSSAGSSSSSMPDCVCMGCFRGNCMVTCSDGSTRTCQGDFENCSELKNSPEWTQCTAPSSSPSGGSSSGGGGGSSASPSSQDNAINGLNALIDTVHHSNELQEVGHRWMRDGLIQNKSFFDDVRGFFGGLLTQVTGIFNNTNNINSNTNKIKNNLTNIEKKLDSIKNRPRDTTIVNVGGDTININGDTNIINIPIDSNIGRPWDTTGGLVGSFQGLLDSTLGGTDTLPNWDTIHRGPVDSIGKSVISTWDSGAGKYYKDTMDAWMSSGLQNSVLSGQGSNNCPAFLMSSYPMTIGNITFDLTQNVKLGQYLCQPVIGGKSGWELGRTILRIIVSIGCMFFLFKCATGTTNEE